MEVGGTILVDEPPYSMLDKVVHKITGDGAGANVVVPTQVATSSVVEAFASSGVHLAAGLIKKQGDGAAAGWEWAQGRGQDRQLAGRQRRPGRVRQT